MAFEKTFMQPEYLQTNWLVMDGNVGVVFADADEIPAIKDFTLDLETEEELDELYEQFSEGGETCYSAEIQFGWGVRLGAPGYLDCTEWMGVYETQEEALEQLTAIYGDD